jgi:hypothetical protein
MFQMEKSEQRFFIKSLFLKGLGAKAIHRELTAVLASTTYSLSQIKSNSGVRASRQATFHAKTNSGLGVRLMCWERLYTISLKSFRSPVQQLLRNSSINLNRRSKRICNESSGYSDSLEGESSTRCPPLKKLIGKQCRSTC